MPNDFQIHTDGSADNTQVWPRTCAASAWAVIVTRTFNDLGTLHIGAFADSAYLSGDNA